MVSWERAIKTYICEKIRSLTDMKEQKWFKQAQPKKILLGLKLYRIPPKAENITLHSLNLSNVFMFWNKISSLCSYFVAANIKHGFWLLLLCLVPVSHVKVTDLLTLLLLKCWNVLGVFWVFFSYTGQKAFSFLQFFYRSDIPGNHECIRGHLLFMNPMVQSCCSTSALLWQN